MNALKGLYGSVIERPAILTPNMIQKPRIDHVLLETLVCAHYKLVRLFLAIIEKKKNVLVF